MLPAALSLLLALCAVACAVNPATGRSQLDLVGVEQEIEMGRQSDQEIVASLGVYPDEAVGAYVRGLGERLAARSERADLAWTFRVVDDPTVNAFALPGGFVYVTRGLMTYLTSEAQLAAVMGHEIGHVTARHTVNRISKAQLAGIGIGIAAVLEPAAADYGSLAQAGLGLVFLKFSRDDERQADDLGLRYLVRAGYDPHPMPGVFDTLRRVSEAAGGGKVPGWLATHPDPEDRSRRIGKEIAALPAASLGTTVNREAYLSHVDGMVFGDDPRQGFFEGTVFYHPGLALRLAFPAGWKTQNSRSTVSAVSPNQDAIVVLGLAKEGSAEAAARAFFGQEGVEQGSAWKSAFNGLSGAGYGFAATTGQQGDLSGLVAFVEHGRQVYQLLGFSLKSKWSGYSSAVSDSLASFARLTDKSKLAVQPNRIELLTLKRPATLAELAAAHHAAVPAAILAIANQVEEGARLDAGTEVKLVVPGRSK